MSDRFETVLQAHLRNGGTLKDLEERFSIKVKRHPAYPNLVQFKYDQIASPMGEKIVQECRGAILDEDDNWNYVARPFDKFFNYGEGHAAKVDWPSAWAQEKLDGSLIILYWYDGKWQVATSGTPDAGGDVNGIGMTFADLFWKVFNELGYKLPDSIKYREFTYMLELMTPYNRVVVQHKSNRLVWIGMRNKLGGDEINVSDWHPTHATFPKIEGQWERVKSFKLATVEQVLATFAKMDPLEQEGYVVVDPYFRRVKVKHPGYVAIHQLRDGFGPKRVLELIRSGERTEFLTYFPEWTSVFNQIQERFDALLNDLSATYERIKEIPEQKSFALEATKTKWPGALFALRAGKTPSLRAFFAAVNIKHLMDCLNVKDVEF